MAEHITNHHTNHLSVKPINREMRTNKTDGKLCIVLSYLPKYCWYKSVNGIVTLLSWSPDFAQPNKNTTTKKQ